MLALAEGEATDVADRARLLSFINTAEALRAVFDDLQAMLAGDFHNRIHIGHNAV